MGLNWGFCHHCRDHTILYEKDTMGNMIYPSCVGCLGKTDDNHVDKDFMKDYTNSPSGAEPRRR